MRGRKTLEDADVRWRKNACRMQKRKGGGKARKLAGKLARMKIYAGEKRAERVFFLNARNRCEVSQLQDKSAKITGEFKIKKFTSLH